MTENRSPYLRDRKLDVPLHNKNDSVQLILEWFLHGIEEVPLPHRIGGQLEDMPYNEKLYETLGWQAEQHFDVISSFWSVFACAVIVEVHANTYACRRQFYKFPDYINYFTPWISGGKTGTGKGRDRNPSFPEKYFSAQFPVIRKIVDGTLASFPKLREFAALTHSVANFSPCPPPPFNRTKGTWLRIHDFLPLFVDLIERQSGETSPLPNRYCTHTISPEVLREWKRWLIQNRERLFLEGYYETSVDAEGNRHICGIPFFSGQSLSHPLPQTKEEVSACLDEMVRRIQARAEKMSGFAPLAG